VVLEHNKHGPVENDDWNSAAVTANYRQTPSFAEQTLPTGNATPQGCLIYSQFFLKFKINIAKSLN